MDVRKLDFSDESFAGIWCNAVLIHLNDADVAKALAEFRRVLVPGGTLFATFKHGEGEEVRQGSFTNSAPRYYKFQTVESVTGLVEQSGLAVDKIYSVNELERWGLERAEDLVHCFARKD
jgi:ubiquinone/menaquinone biosynthesis C-methylase UbiE